MAKRKIYNGKLEVVPDNQILLNISELKNGSYILKIMEGNRVIKVTRFIKRGTKDNG